jgi:plasmid rolling circle replication initiator protein Rep
MINYNKKEQINQEGYYKKQNETECQLEEILIDKSSHGKVRKWKEKKEASLLLSESYERLKSKKAYRVAKCGDFLEFKVFTDGKMKLHSAGFCKVRLCSMCNWRRSLKTFGQVSKVMDEALKDTGREFLFLTLTCKNVEGSVLSKQLDIMFNSFKLLMKRKDMKVFDGWFRALEVTYNRTTDEYHPHFHIILMTTKNYFKKDNLYITQSKFTDLWKESLGVDYTPIVDIRKFTTHSRKSLSKAVAEVSTYTVKDNEVLIEDEEGNIDVSITDKVVTTLDGALTNRRLVAYGKELRKIHKRLNLDDSIDGDLKMTNIEEEIREDVNYIIRTYHWNVGISNYSTRFSK